MNEPILRHIDCEIEGCRVCIVNADELESYLEIETGNKSICHLEKYREFLDEHNIKAETNFGWFTENVFSPENLHKYIKTIKT